MALTACVQVRGVVVQAFPEEGGRFAPCLRVALPVSIVPSPGWGAAAAAARVGLSGGSKQSPTSTVLGQQWLFDLLLGSLSAWQFVLPPSPFGEGVNFVVGITPGDKPIQALGI